MPFRELREAGSRGIFEPDSNLMEDMDDGYTGKKLSAGFPGS